MSQEHAFYRSKTFNRRKIWLMFLAVFFVLMFLGGRLVYLMVFCSEYYGQKAEDLHERERDIKAARGRIIDATGKILATNKSVCTISVIHSQIDEPEKVIAALQKELGLTEEEVRKRVEKVSSIERVKTNVDKETGDRIRAYGLSGIKVDEDYKRYYPLDTMASTVLGFTGADNQGILGLEVKYDSYLQGTSGKILTLTDARGIEQNGIGESRQEPVAGRDLKVSLDVNIQAYCQQAAEKAMAEKQADSVSILLMNPQNGEIYAMVNVPEFNLNEPYRLNDKTEDQMTDEERQNRLNQMWRNRCINDTYEPGSTFKIITSAACLEEGVVSLDDTFSCPGYRIVEDRKIRCHKVGGHGTETFVQGIENSCNPVFMDIGLRLGSERFCDYFEQFGLMSLTNIDLPGEAGTIMHKREDIKAVELATMTFGQSFQITPIQMAVTVSSMVNGGRRVTPHLGVSVLDKKGKTVKTFKYGEKEGIVSEKTSETMQELLEKVVSEGSGKNAYLEGYSIGGKTATSQTLPRSAGKYISSFIGFAPADDPQILGMVIIHDPQGIYYGGTIAAPVLRDIYDNVLPYLGIEKK